MKHEYMQVSQEMGKAWKDFERYVARMFETTRIPVPGRSGPDVKTDKLFIDCKLRAEVPSTYIEVLDAGERLGYPVISAQTKNGTDLLMMKFNHFLRLKNIDEIKKNGALRISIKMPDTPGDWLLHMKESTPEGHTPVVVMRKPRQHNTSAVMIVEDK